jgi:ankyrin repeat protein
MQVSGVPRDVFLSEDDFRLFYAAYDNDVLLMQSLNILEWQVSLTDACSAYARLGTLILRFLPHTQVNIVDYDGRTPLGVAASQGNAEAVMYLLAHGANYSIKDIRCACLLFRAYLFINHQIFRRGNTAIEDAKREKRDAVVKILGKRQSSSAIAFPQLIIMTEAWISKSISSSEL